jgi:thioesterase domain-containing protein/acyl carrier protein
LPTGAAGELWIFGVGVGVGYLHDAAQTAASFVDGGYRTGDRVRVNANGQLTFLGRLDGQIKLRGLRLEPAEIELALIAVDGIKQAAVGIKAEQLVAYVVVSDAVDRASFTAATLQRHLGEQLPAFMCPQRVMVLDALPLNVHGKLARELLPEPSSATKDYVPPRDAVEAQLITIFQQLLTTTEIIGIHDNFFDLGGHSLIAVRLMTLINEQFAQDLPLSALFQCANIADLADLLRGSSHLETGCLLTLQAEGEEAPLFCVHGVSGEVMNLVALADAMRDSNRPFIAVQARGVLAGETPHDDLSAMVTDYVAEIRLKQPCGPYHLSGHSIGGVIAWEMARQLQQAGEEVALLALIDAPSPTFINKQQKRFAFSSLIGQDKTPLADGLDMTPVMEANARLFATQCLKGKLETALYCLNASEQPFKHSKGWDKYAKRVNTKTLPGDHDSILQLPAVLELAILLKSLLNSH